MRKIIQLAVATDPDGGGAEVFALFDDGSAWVALAKGWHRMVAIPQDEPAQTDKTDNRR